MYLVFDVGGTFIKYGILDGDGNVLQKGKVPTETENKEKFILSLVDVYDEYRNQNIEGIALSVPGLVDVTHGIQIQDGAVKCLWGMNIVEELSKRCDYKHVAVENDGKCAGLAEVWIGAAKKVKNAAVLAFGTGIAGCIIVDGKVLHGGHLMAGESSFLIARPDFASLDIHQMGFDYSTIGFLKRAKKVVGREVTGEEVYQLIDEGNEALSALLNEWYFNIACQCYNIQVTTDPELICIGGGISAEPRFVEGIKRYVDLIAANSFQMFVPRIVTCAFRNDSNLIGALYNYKQIYEGAQ